MPHYRDKVRQHLLKVMNDTGLKASQLARLAGIRHTTITRFLNDPSFTGTPTSRTLGLIDEALAKLRADQPNTRPSISDVQLTIDPTQGIDEEEFLRIWRRLSVRQRLAVAAVAEGFLDSPALDEAQHLNS